MRRAAAAFALSLVAAACQKSEEQQAPVQPEQTNSPRPEVRSPVLLRYKPAERGGLDTFMAANIHGVLDLSGPCVRLQNMAGQSRTVVSASGSRLARDSAGLYWQIGDERLRHGASVVAGGGEMPRLPPDQLIDGPVPQGCSGPAVELIGPERYDPEP